MNAVKPPEKPPVIIRSMTAEDIPQVSAVDRLSFSMPWPKSAYEYELKENPLSLLWVAESQAAKQDSAVIGMIVVWLIVDEAHIATIAVLPEYRSQGIARRLLTIALQAIVQRDYRIATLEVRAGNLAAQNLYRQFGFETVGIRPKYYRDNNEDALIMTVDHLDQAYLNRLARN